VERRRPDKFKPSTPAELPSSEATLLIGRDRGWSVSPRSARRHLGERYRGGLGRVSVGRRASTPLSRDVYFPPYNSSLLVVVVVVEKIQSRGRGTPRTDGDTVGDVTVELFLQRPD